MSTRGRIDKILSNAPGRDLSLVLGEMFQAIADSIDRIERQQIEDRQAFEVTARTRRCCD